MIVYDFASEEVTRTDEDGNEYTTERRGSLQVWFFDSDPQSDPPDQTYDWRADNANLRWSVDTYPVEVKSECVSAEVANSNTLNSNRIVQIIADGALENIERR
jgi:hypothetical protein